MTSRQARECHCVVSGLYEAGEIVYSFTYSIPPSGCSIPVSLLMLQFWKRSQAQILYVAIGKFLPIVVQICDVEPG
jgi:hypothetical protein